MSSCQQVIPQDGLEEWAGLDLGRATAVDISDETAPGGGGSLAIISDEPSRSRVEEGMMMA